MLIEYVHPILGQDIEGRAGYSVPLEEGIMEYEGREVLYTLGYACVERSCCSGNSTWGYIQVPGYVISRQIGSDHEGASVSQVEIIENEEDRARIKQVLLSKYPGSQVEIWGVQYRQ